MLFVYLYRQKGKKKYPIQKSQHFSSGYYSELLIRIQKNAGERSRGIEYPTHVQTNQPASYSVWPHPPHPRMNQSLM